MSDLATEEIVNAFGAAAFVWGSRVLDSAKGEETTGYTYRLDRFMTSRHSSIETFELRHAPVDAVRVFQNGEPREHLEADTENGTVTLETPDGECIFVLYRIESEGEDGS